MVVISNTCNEVFSFKIEGRTATFLAEEDRHDPKYDDIVVTAPFADLYNPASLPDGQPMDHCIFTMSVYPTEEFEEAYKSNEPWIYAVIVVGVLAFTSLAFVFYDCLVTNRQSRLLTTAKKQNAIVSSLYPKAIQKQLMDEVDVKHSGMSKQTSFRMPSRGTRDGLNAFIAKDHTAENGMYGVDAVTKSKPIADMFPETTIMFADIAGFTAWSAAREPTQVFQLLEAVYREFDSIAKRLKVYKVEVVGYVQWQGKADLVIYFHLRFGSPSLSLK